MKTEPARLGGLYDDEERKHNRGSIWDAEGLSPTLVTNGGGYSQPMIEESNPWYAVAQRKREDGQMIEQSNREIANAITSIQTDSMVGNIRIRKLTPRECWRLMGFTDEDFDKAAKVCSDSRLYSQAGNSIVVDVLCAIFGKML